jgi:cytochrome P450
MFANGIRNAGMEILLESMLWQDDPQHRRLRSLVSKSFSIKEVELQRPRIRRIAEGLLDAITTDQFDLIRVFADPLPAVVVGEMLGVHASHREQFKRWSEAVFRGLFNPRCSADESREAGDAVWQSCLYFAERVQERRQAPGTDLISELIPKLGLVAQKFQFCAWPGFLGTHQLWLVKEASSQVR